MNEIKSTISEQLQQLQMLMHRVQFHSNAGSGRMRDPHRGQGRVLAILKMKPEISQRDLTYLLDMSKQSIAELLTKLEKSEYITREQSAADKRVMIVKLTDKGSKAADSIEDKEPITAKVLDCLNETELAAFSDYLERIIKVYENEFPDDDFEQRRRSMEEFMMQNNPRDRFWGRREW